MKSEDDILNGIELVIFDWSGVISDDRLPVYNANMNLLRQYGKKPISFEEWIITTKRGPAEFARSMGINEPYDRIFSLYTDLYEQEIESGVRSIMYEDVKITLQHLRDKGKLMAVVSTHPTSSLMREAKEYGIEKFFHNISGSNENKVDKIKDIYERFDENSEKVVYVGDMIYDIRAAREAGVCAIGCCAGYHSREQLEAENPKAIIEHLSELSEII